MTSNQILYKNISSKIEISENEFELIASSFHSVHINKKDIIVTEGKISDKIYFIEKGLLFSYKTLENGENQVIQFAKEDYWISDLYSYFSNSKSLFSIQALEESKLWVSDKKKLEKLFSNLPKMETFLRLSFQNAYISTLLRISDIYTKDAESKYNRMQEKQSDLLQRVPQYLIASYLGILPSSLSRIKNKK